MNETDCPKALSGEHVYLPSPFKTGRPACKNCGTMKPITRYHTDRNGHIVPTPEPRTVKVARRKSRKLSMPEAIKRHLEHVKHVTDLGARDDPFVPVWDLRSREIDLGDGEVYFLGTSGDRRARELAEAGEIIVEHRGGFAHYAAKGANQPVLS